jgi:protein transport protein SEC24
MFYQIPCTGDLLTMSGMSLALMIQPFSLPHPSEEPIQVHFGLLHLKKCFCWTHVPQFFERYDILILGNSV